MYRSTDPLLRPGLDTFRFVERYYRHYLKLFSGNNYQQHNSWEFDNLITLLNDAALADFWVPALLHYREVYEEKRILAFLRKLESKFCGDWVTYQTPTDRIRAMNQITVTIDSLRQSNLNPDEQIDNLLNSSVFDYDRDLFFQILQEEEIYRRRFARYLLLKLDVLYGSADTRLQPYKWMSVEHILPQTPEDNSQWCRDFSEQERQIWTHRLGNLIMLSRRKNSSQGRLDFKLDIGENNLNSAKRRTVMS